WCRRTCSFGRPSKAAESWQRQTSKLSLSLSEHNARRTAPGVAQATSGTRANALTLLFAPQHCRARPAQSLPQSACGKEVEQGQSVPITTSGFTKEQYKRQMLDLDAKPQEGMIFHSAGQDSCESRV